MVQCYTPEVAGQHIVELMPLALHGLTLESSELREFTYGFFANVSSVGPRRSSTTHLQ